MCVENLNNLILFLLWFEPWVAKLQIMGQM